MMKKLMGKIKTKINKQLKKILLPIIKLLNKFMKFLIEGDRGHEVAGDVLLQCAEGFPGVLRAARFENSFGFGLLEETACNDGRGGGVDPGQREV